MQPDISIHKRHDDVPHQSCRPDQAYEARVATVGSGVLECAYGDRPISDTANTEQDPATPMPADAFEALAAEREHVTLGGTVEMEAMFLCGCVR